MGAASAAWDWLSNARVARRATEYASLPGDWFRSRVRPDSPDTLFDTVHTFVVFIGIGRSGTTLAGALLDAHPQAVIAHQQCVWKYLSVPGFSRERLFRLLRLNSAAAAARGRPGGGGYRYAVDGQHQGEHRDIQVIGDKSRSAQSVEWLNDHPGCLESLLRLSRARLRMIHMVRNPWDTIARRALRREVSLQRISGQYFDLSEKLASLRWDLDARRDENAACVEIHLEDLVGDPVPVLETLGNALGLEAEPGWLRQAAALVRPEISRPRECVDWPSALRDSIEAESNNYEWLKRYDFDV